MVGVYLNDVNWLHKSILDEKSQLVSLSELTEYSVNGFSTHNKIADYVNKNHQKYPNNCILWYAYYQSLRKSNNIGSLEGSL